jgi:membrane-associated phospholipid phosphatase
MTALVRGSVVRVDTTQHVDLDPVDRARRAAAILAGLLGPAGRSDPYRLYGDLHALGPVAGPMDNTYIVAGYDAVNQVLRDPGFGLPDPASSGSEPSDSSLHAGWALWVALSVQRWARASWLRWAGWLHAGLTALVVIDTGNHWTLDVVAGWFLALITWTAARPARPRPDAPSSATLPETRGCLTR